MCYYQKLNNCAMHVSLSNHMVYALLCLTLIFVALAHDVDNIDVLFKCRHYTNNIHYLRDH